jgi:hypothetical protein
MRERYPLRYPLAAAAQHVVLVACVDGEEDVGRRPARIAREDGRGGGSGGRVPRKHSDL